MRDPLHRDQPDLVVSVEHCKGTIIADLVSYVLVVLNVGPQGGLQGQDLVVVVRIGCVATE